MNRCLFAQKYSEYMVSLYGVDYVSAALHLKKPTGNWASILFVCQVEQPPTSIFGRLHALHAMEKYRARKQTALPSSITR